MVCRCDWNWSTVVPPFQCLWSLTILMSVHSHVSVQSFLIMHIRTFMHIKEREWVNWIWAACLTLYQCFTRSDVIIRCSYPINECIIVIECTTLNGAQTAVMQSLMGCLSPSFHSLPLCTLSVLTHLAYANLTQHCYVRRASINKTVFWYVFLLIFSVR